MASRFIGDYKILDGPFLGGFGEVYKVLDQTWCDEFALKTLKGAFLPSSERLARFRREVELWINLPTHANVVRAIEAFEFEGRPYLVMEWVPGGTLRERLSAFGAVEALAICRQLADGMGHIQEHGLVHGDLKPANVLMWGSMWAQITDFGLANVLSDERTVVGGTRGYMAPELQYGSATVQSDVYALGVIFQELLAQFRDDDFGVAGARVLATDMTHADPTHRPQSFSQVLDRLNHIIHAPPYWPTIIMPGVDRRTFKEKTTAEALPERHLMSKARSAMAAGHRGDARRALMQVVNQRSDHADAITMLADLAAEDGDRELAATRLREARKASGGNPKLLFNICVSLVGIGEHAEAREILALLNEPEGMAHRIWQLQGDIANKEGDLSEALTCYRRAVESGGDASAVLSLARALGDAGLPDEAIALLQSIDIRDSQVGIHAQVLLARCLINKRQWEEGVNTLRSCLRQDVGTDTSAYVYSEIGYAYMQQGLFDAAVAAFSKSLKLRPGSEVVLRNLDYCRNRLRQ